MAVVIPQLNSDVTKSLTSTYHKTYVYGLCAVVALGGILFGFDMVIISGTVPFFSTHFALSETGIGWAVGCINLGAAAGALLSGKLSSEFGRKKVLLICAMLFAVTGVATGWATSFGMFISARLLSGVAVGVAALVCPMYLAEVAPAPMRGRLVSLYQLAIVSGLLLAYLSNYLLLNTGDNNWRWMFSSQTIPALLFFAGLFFIPESPRWLVLKKKTADAFRVLSRIGGEAYADMELSNIKGSFAFETKENFRDLFKRDVRHIVLIGVMVAVFSQTDGQNSLFSYAPVIFQQSGIAAEEAFLQSVVLGVINFVFTFIAIIFIDSVGRRKLLLYGSILLGFDAMALATSFYFGASAYLTLFLVLAFIAIYAATLGPATWVVISEIFPNRIRGSSMALATLCLWIANFFTIASFPILKEYFGLHITFALHAGICFVYFLYVMKKIPETKGRSLEDIELQLTKKAER